MVVPSWWPLDAGGRAHFLLHQSRRAVVAYCPPARPAAAARRIAKGLSQESLAHAAGISTYTYQKFEKGESRPGTPMNPRLRTLTPWQRRWM